MKSYDAVAGVVDDLCHVLGVRKAEVVSITINPGVVDVLIRDEVGVPHMERFSWTLSY